MSQSEPRIDPGPPAFQRGYGCLIAAGVLIGPVVGWAFGQITIGLLAGLAIGVGLAVLMSRR